MQDSVSIHNKPAQAGVSEDVLEAIEVSAFREPDTAGFPAKAVPIIRASDKYLRPDGRRVLKQRQHRMRRGAGDYFDIAKVLVFSEFPNEIPLAGQVELAGTTEPIKVKAREFLEGRFPLSAVHFLLGQLDEVFQVLAVSLLEQRIEKHGAKRGTEREG